MGKPRAPYSNATTFATRPPPPPARRVIEAEVDWLDAEDLIPLETPRPITRQREETQRIWRK